jgi:hypothetical protein
MRQAGEPSVEDILESIKKVIARDARPDVAPRAPMSAADAAAAIAPALASGPAVTMKPAQPDVLDLTEVAAQIMNEARRGPVAPCAGAQDEDGDSLLPPETTESMRDSLAALAMLAQPGAQPQIVRSGETSLEGMVRDMLRPMLADWLERNLPGMVEKMVAAEIARIAGKRG